MYRFVTLTAQGEQVVCCVFPLVRPVHNVMAMQVASESAGTASVAVPAQYLLN